MHPPALPLSGQLLNTSGLDGGCLFYIDTISLVVERSSLFIAGGFTNSSPGRIRNTEVVGQQSCDYPMVKVRSRTHGITTSDGLHLLCGGAASNVFRSCTMFNHSGPAWSEYFPLLEDRQWASPVALPSGTYMLGGRDSPNTSDFLPVGSSTGWSRGPAIPGPGVHTSCAADLNSTHFVVIGGSSSGGGQLVRVYNTLAAAWTNWPQLPVRLSYPACLRVGRQVLVTGGSDIDTGESTSTFLKIDINTGEMTTGSPLQQARQGHEMVEFEGKVLVVSGAIYPDIEKRTTSIEELDETTGRWKFYPTTLQRARVGFGLFSIPVKPATLCPF